MKPNFYVIGAAKAATTSLCDLIGTHPDVFFCGGKEPGFFSYNFSRGIDWYESLFAHAGTALALGEGSTTYSQTGLWPQTVKRLVSYSPDARIVYIVREPMRRIQSHWVQWRVEGRIEPGPFAEAVREVPALIDASLYWKQISVYRDYFPDERILVLFFEDFAARPDAVVRTVFKFLGLKTEVPLSDADRARNQSRHQRVPRLTGRLLHRLPGYYELRRRLPLWLRKPISPVLSKPFSEQPVWDEATRAWVLERVRPDARQFLRCYDKPPDYWATVTDSA